MLQNAFGEWLDVFVNDVVDRDGITCYAITYDNGDQSSIPVEDISEVLETRKNYKIGMCAILPFKRNKTKRA